MPLAEAFCNCWRAAAAAAACAGIGRAWSVCRPGPRKVIAMAAAVEMLHNATLVHDDLIDNAPCAAGDNVNPVWNKGATCWRAIICSGGLPPRRRPGHSRGAARDAAHHRRRRAAPALLQPRVEPAEHLLPATLPRRLPSLAAASAGDAGGCHVGQEQALDDYGKHLGMAFRLSMTSWTMRATRRLCARRRPARHRPCCSSVSIAIRIRARHRAAHAGSNGSTADADAAAGAAIADDCSVRIGRDGAVGR